ASEGRNQDFMQTPEAPQLHDAYVIKPVRLNLLLDHIGRLLKLSWCYEQTHELSLPIIEKNTTINALLLPDEVHLESLRELARIGHRKGLLERLQQMEDSGLAHRDFANQVRELTKIFHFEKILSLIDFEDQPISLHEKPAEIAP